MQRFNYPLPMLGMVQGRRWWLVPLSAAVGGFVLVGCVNNRENARQFCEAQEAVLAPSRDDERLTQDEARAVADDVAESMRDAEDATRAVRGAARDLTEAYDELVDLLGDDDATAEERKENEQELRQARVEVRAACREALASQ